jgi:hypothetical protein
MIINGIEISGAGGSSGTSGISGSSGTSGSSGISGSSGSSGISGSSGTSGTSISSNRFITSSKTLSAGLEEVLNDMFIISSTYSISSYNATYSIAGNVIYNDALLNILDIVWIDGVLSVEGDFKLGI